MQFLSVKSLIILQGVNHKTRQKPHHFALNKIDRYRQKALNKYINLSIVLEEEIPIFRYDPNIKKNQKVKIISQIL